MREQKDRYEIFLKVCETGSFSKAAEALNYTQSGISQMMAGLEEELGVQLFARINRGVTLTDNGTRLLPYIRELANQKTRLRQGHTGMCSQWMPLREHSAQRVVPERVEFQVVCHNG